jgi:hypothetical protein
MAATASGGQMRAFAFFVIIAIISASNVGAQTVTECGDSQGYAYFFQGGSVPPGQGGMHKDAITGGRIILNYENNEVDLIINHAMGSTLSAKQQGANIVVLPSSNVLIALTVFYKGGITVENYIFQLDSLGNGTLAWTGMRTQAVINKLSLMQSRCVGPRK